MQQKLTPAYVSQLDTRSFLHRDPPDHTRLRRLVAMAFTARRVEAMRRVIQAKVDEIIDAVAAAGRIDIVADLAWPLPIYTISRVIGVPPERQAVIEPWPRAQLC